MSTFDLEFHLVEVTAPAPPQPTVAARDLYESAHEVPVHFLRGVADRLVDRSYRATWDLRIGNPAHELVRIAGEHDVNLIALPAHGRRGFNALITEVLAEEVRGTRDVPLLIVHPQVD